MYACAAQFKGDASKDAWWHRPAVNRLPSGKKFDSVRHPPNSVTAVVRGGIKIQSGAPLSRVNRQFQY